MADMMLKNCDECGTGFFPICPEHITCLSCLLESPKPESGPVSFIESQAVGSRPVWIDPMKLDGGDHAR